MQANAILDMQLRRLTSLERQKLLDELAELRTRIADLEDIITRPDRVRQIIKDELADLANRFGDDTATTRTFPAPSCDATPETGIAATSTCPPITLVNDWTPEVKTTNLKLPKRLKTAPVNPKIFH